MKFEETVAEKFLCNRFAVAPKYEPLGPSKAPDFSIAASGFEVRRLNQRYFHPDGTNEALERIEYPITIALRNELQSVRFSEPMGTIFWGLGFRRPVAVRPRDVATFLGTAARNYYAAGLRKRERLTYSNVELELIPASDSIGKSFAMGYISDDDSGGFLGHIYPISIELALKDKIAKTQGISDRFDHWGLILVDMILPEMMEPSDVGPLDHLALGHFNSLVIIDPSGKLSLDLPKNSLTLFDLK